MRVCQKHMKVYWYAKEAGRTVPDPAVSAVNALRRRPQSPQQRLGLFPWRWYV